ncbi:TlpA disulfide reductase family protein [Hymenobacter glacialis]|uniref:Thioredoxin domain-containing protein n=1 Tax=Hymenobacter glacialis TaxID=1908236 RepID=A0A1G1T121_9BACT|nr:TlpA disulfide reductase family protein [Hymenobacter glacialis]OGX84581.1 hypothetical protein BEN48_02220 [Hymenobacter glacialis]
MMKTHLAGLLLLAPGLALAQSPAPATYPYIIKGKISQLDAPAKVYLVRGTERLDSATLQHGRFEMKGTTPQHMTVSLVLERQGRLQDGWREQMRGGKMSRYYFESPDRVRLFLEPGPVVVTSSDSVFKALVKGGRLTTDYQQRQEAMKTMADNFEKATPRGSFTAYHNEEARTKMAFIKAHPASWVSFETLQELPPGTTYNEKASLYAALSPALRNSPAGQQYGQLLAKQKTTAIGAQAPDFVQPTPAGKQVSLADYRGKYVLLDFWASWCSPCRAEHPQMVKVYEAYKNRNFEVLGISFDEGRDRWLKAIADDNLPWTQVADLRGPENEIYKRYNLQGIPQNFLIDPTGKIVAVNLRGDDLVAQLAKFIK